MSDPQLKNSRIYVVVFALTTALIFSLLITAAASLLKERQQENMALDQKKNLLSAAGLLPGDSHPTPDQVARIYTTRIREVTVGKNGVIQAAEPDRNGLQLYLIHENQQVQGYILPISTRGLWGKIHGYLAFERDGRTVSGFSVYNHSETPGLGGEIESQWFQDNFKGKKILNAQNRFVSVGIAKGKADNLPENLQDHYVDGISGATLTGKYLSEGLEKTLMTYEPVSIIFRQKKGTDKQLDTLLDDRTTNE